MKILCLNNDETGSNFYRIRTPLEELARHGHEVRLPNSILTHELVGPFATAQSAKLPSEEDLDWADVVVGRQLSHPGLKAHWDRWQAFAPVIYETDDDLFHVDTTNPALIVFLHPGVADTLLHLLRTADLVTVSTPYLGEQMREYNHSISVLPNCIDSSLLELTPHRHSTKVTVGWAGSASHIADWMANARPIRQWFLANPQVDFHIVGIDYRPMLEVPARFTPWRQLPYNYYRSIDFDIGLAPLVLNNFNRAKSAVKALEYAALGIPTVATRGVAYDNFIVHGETGFLVETAEQWSEYLGELVSNHPLRLKMGKAAREVAAEWTIQKRWVEWEQAYAEVLDRESRTVVE